MVEIDRAGACRLSFEQVQTRSFGPALNILQRSQFATLNSFIWLIGAKFNHVSAVFEISIRFINYQVFRFISNASVIKKYVSYEVIDYKYFCLTGLRESEQKLIFSEKILASEFRVNTQVTNAIFLEPNYVLAVKVTAAQRVVKW